MGRIELKQAINQEKSFHKLMMNDFFKIKSFYERYYINFPDVFLICNKII